MVASAAFAALLTFGAFGVLRPQAQGPHFLHEYTLPAGAYPSSIVTGSDGAMWFGIYPYFTNHPPTHLGIGRITTKGRLSFIHIGRGIYDVTEGRDGKVWFTNAYRYPHTVGSVTAGGVVKQFPVPSNGTPESIAGDADGDLWYIAFGASPDVIRIAPDGSTVATYTTPRREAARLAPGNGETMWTALAGQRTHVGRFTTAGAFRQAPIGGPAYIPGPLTRGSDGRMWISDCVYAAAVTPTFEVTLYPLPQPNSCLYGITAGPDGNLWATDFGTSSIVRITPTGVMTEYPTPTPNMIPAAITAGPDGNIWFTEIQQNTDISKIGVLAPK